jgi:pilus assembly protein CpaF
MTPAEVQTLLKEKASPASSAPSFGRRKQAPPTVQQQPAAISSAKELNDIQSLLNTAVSHAAALAGRPLPEPRIATLDADTMLSPHLEHGLTIALQAFKNTVDARQFARLSRKEALAEIHMIVEQISVHHPDLALSPGEVTRLAKALSDEVLGLGPLEPLLARDDISEIMVNGPNTVYIEIDGIIERSQLSFRDEEQLVQICQRIAQRVGRHVDEASPICDARLHDGSRVNIILPPLSLHGASLTIRKFKKDKLTLDKLVQYGSIDELGAELIRIIAGCRINTIVSGGTGSGKTTMLNCLTRYIDPRERIITCEDAAELQLQQPHVVSLETRMANLEGAGEVTMRDLVKNCLRMRPERIIVGEVRGTEAFDLLQAMNTGHDGSMGTVHANTPRDALDRIESMVAMNRLNIPPETIRRQIASSINVIIQVQRLRDGTRKVMSISELIGMEGDTVTMQDLLTYEIDGEDENGMITGYFKPTGLHPRFYHKLREFGMQHVYDKVVEKYMSLNRK